MPRSLCIRRPTRRELRQLDQRLESALGARPRRRVEAIVLHATGLAATEIADALGAHRQPEQIEIHKVDPAVEQRQVERLRAVRRRRDNARVAALLDRPEREARDPSVNLMPVTIELVKARASMGEIVSRLRKVFGTYVEAPVF